MRRDLERVLRGSLMGYRKRAQLDYGSLDLERGVHDRVGGGAFGEAHSESYNFV